MVDWIGRTLGKVEIQERLGRGGMAEVFLGTHTTLARPVAVKALLSYLSDDPELQTRFEREARAVAALRHPNIVQVFDFDVADDRPYMVMEYIEGISLAEYLYRQREAGRTLAADTIARLVAPLASALDSAHAHGIIHRDVKPANVLLRRDAGPLAATRPLPPDVEPVLTDFGVMRMVGEGRQTVAGRVFGTPVYMSPEQARGETVDGRSDIYSLGAMLYELFAGTPPFNPRDETPSSLLLKHISMAPAPIPGLPPAVQAVIDRALSKDPAARYQKAGDLAADLQAALGSAIPATLPTLAIPLETPLHLAAAAPVPPGPPTTPPGGRGPAYIEMLRQIDIFQGLDDAFLAQVAAVLVEQRVQAGTLLFHRGDPGDVLYIVLAGRIKIFGRDLSGAERVLAFNDEGSFFGEMALLTGEPRSASAEAVADSRLLLLAKSDFDPLLARNIAIPLTMLQVIARRQSASDRQLIDTPTGGVPIPDGRGQVFVVFSPKGGAGVSTVAVNLAVTLAHEYPDHVALLDLSLTFGHSALLLNLVPRSGLADIRLEAAGRMDRATLSNYLVPHASTLRLLAGTLRLEDRDSVTAAQVQAVLELLRRHFPYVVVDTSSTLTLPVLAAIETADRIVLLATPERTTLRDLRECRRLFADVRGVPRARLYYVMNHLTAHPVLSHEQFEEVLEGTLDAGLPYGGDLPARAAYRGEPLVALGPNTPLAAAIDRLAAALIGSGAEVAHPAPNML